MNTIEYLSTAFSRTTSPAASPSLTSTEAASPFSLAELDESLAGATDALPSDDAPTDAEENAAVDLSYLSPLPEDATSAPPPEPERDPTSPDEQQIPKLKLDQAQLDDDLSCLPEPGPDTVYLSSSLRTSSGALALSSTEPARVRAARERQRARLSSTAEEKDQVVDEKKPLSDEDEVAEGERRLAERRERARVSRWSIRLGVGFYMIFRALFGWIGFKPFGKANLSKRGTLTIDSPPAATDLSSASPPSPLAVSPSATPISASTIKQPPRLTPKTLVLDLDETLIHSTSRPFTNNRRTRQLKVRVVEVVLDGRSTVYTVYKRPWVDFFLRKVSTWYTVVIFTASLPEYADPVIDWLDGGDGAGGMVGGRLFRADCLHANGSYLKDLSVVEKDLSKVCLVDNSPVSYAINQANGIPIEGWINDPNDECLLDLLPMLDSLRFTNDVRRVLGLRGFGRS